MMERSCFEAKSKTGIIHQNEVNRKENASVKHNQHPVCLGLPVAKMTAIETGHYRQKKINS
jgi:hypothetical protein